RIPKKGEQQWQTTQLRPQSPHAVWSARKPLRKRLQRAKDPTSVWKDPSLLASRGSWSAWGMTWITSLVGRSSRWAIRSLRSAWTQSSPCWTRRTRSPQRLPSSLDHMSRIRLANPLSPDRLTNRTGGLIANNVLNNTHNYMGVWLALLPGRATTMML